MGRVGAAAQPIDRSLPRGDDDRPPTSAAGNAPPARAGNSPARTSDDLPAPEGPDTTTRRAVHRSNQRAQGRPTTVEEVRIHRLVHRQAPIRTLARTAPLRCGRRVSAAEPPTSSASAWSRIACSIRRSPGPGRPRVPRPTPIARGGRPPRRPPAGHCGTAPASGGSTSPPATGPRDQRLQLGHDSRGADPGPGRRPAAPPAARSGHRPAAAARPAPTRRRPSRRTAPHATTPARFEAVLRRRTSPPASAARPAAASHRDALSHASRWHGERVPVTSPYDVLARRALGRSGSNAVRNRTTCACRDLRAVGGGTPARCPPPTCPRPPPAPGDTNSRPNSARSFAPGTGNGTEGVPASTTRVPRTLKNTSSD